jgi:DNA-binding HxlR family transcriptional regulator
MKEESLQGYDPSGHHDAGSDPDQRVDLVTDKWTVLVVSALQPGKRRLNELQRAMGGISQKMLIASLRRLEEDGLVLRTVYPVVPPKVEYSLTSLGETFFDSVAALCAWTTDHSKEIQQARQRYRQQKQE